MIRRETRVYQLYQSCLKNKSEDMEAIVLHSRQKNYVYAIGNITAFS